MVLLHSIIAALLLGIYSAPAAPEVELDAEEILSRAVDVQKRHLEAKPEVRFDYELQAVTKKLDGDGEVEETDERLYRSHPIEGEIYERLIRKDGRELTEKELEEEAKREKEFRERLANEGTQDGEAESVDFDEELVSRFEVELEAVEPFEGRSCYVIAFSPKQGDLPTDRRIDQLVNKVTGRIWIDRESFEVARVRFELSDRIKRLWGIVGSISAMSGELQRRPVNEDVWLMDRFRFYIQGRILFSSYRVRQELTWDGYAPRDSVAGSASR